MAPEDGLDSVHGLGPGQGLEVYLELVGTLERLGGRISRQSPIEAPRDQGVGGYVGEQVVAADQDAGFTIQEDRV